MCVTDGRKWNSHDVVRTGGNKENMKEKYTRFKVTCKYIQHTSVFVCLGICMWLDLLWRLGTGAVVSTVSGVDWAPCVSNIWCAVVRCGASPHCHRIPSCKHNRVYTNTIDCQSIFRHSLTHWLWSLPHIFHLLWLSSISLSWSFALIHLWPTGSVNLCQYRTKHRRWHMKLSSRISSSACKVPPTNPEPAPALYLTFHHAFLLLQSCHANKPGHWALRLPLASTHIVLSSSSSNAPLPPALLQTQSHEDSPSITAPRPAAL